ncbi:hypothetical protein H0266_02345 [Halobacillus locisalis]|uniref:Uncharacterized protein n=1 Tax=Halobacillus locisalis TaxID=220753 RepID=A0A838CNZ9_9BACI|nr:hypothetical protein [Halobacillus locisalis]MBA2173730.1 hypothetical protein [Halobacillus locisalis]
MILRTLFVTVSFSVLTISGVQDNSIEAQRSTNPSKLTEEKIFENGLLPLPGLEMEPVEPLPVPKDDSLYPLPLK